MTCVTVPADAIARTISLFSFTSFIAFFPFSLTSSNTNIIIRRVFGGARIQTVLFATEIVNITIPTHIPVTVSKTFLTILTSLHIRRLPRLLPENINGQKDEEYGAEGITLHSHSPARKSP